MSGSAHRVCLKVIVGGICLAGWALEAQPLGAEFRVNTSTTFDQYGPSAASDARGNFVIVWAGPDELVDQSTGVFGQRYLFDGTPSGSEFRANTYTSGKQNNASVASTRAGKLLVAWQKIDPIDLSDTEIFAQRYLATGAPFGPEFRVNTHTSLAQGESPRVAASDSAFIVAWDSDGQDGNLWGVFAQRLDATTGLPLGPEFRVNTNTTNGQYVGGVAASPGGSFVIVWVDLDTNPNRVWAQRYAASGAPAGAAFLVNGASASGEYNPRVAAGASGNFVVVWSNFTAPAGIDIFGRRFDSAGAALGAAFHVNTVTTGNQYLGAVSSDAFGNFVVTWTGPDDDLTGGFARRFGWNGAPQGNEFRVNTYTTARQLHPAVASSGFADFVLTWESQQQEEPTFPFYSVRAQRVSPGPHGDANGDGAFNVNDVFYLINYLFAAGPPPLGPCDANGDAAVTVADVFYLINTLFAAGPDPL